MLFRRGQFMRIRANRRRLPRCNSHDRPGAIPALGSPRETGDSLTTGTGRAQTAQHQDAQAASAQCCVDLPEPASRLRTKMRHGGRARHSPAAAAGQEEADEKVVLRADVVRHVSEHRILKCESDKVDSWRMLSISPARCQRKSPAAAALFRGHRGHSGSFKAARTRPLRIGSSGRTRP